MGALLTVARLELILQWRGRGLWAAALIIALLGALQASMVRQTPWGVWNHFVFIAMLVTLLLAFITGGQIRRDGEHRLDGVVLSTPVSTTAYVLGKYLAAVAALLGLAAIGLLAALLTDRFDDWPDPPFFLGESYFPALGGRPYLIGWALLVVVPVLFGAALTLAVGTLIPGGRVASSLSVLALWLLLPLFVSNWPAALDVTGLGAQSRLGAHYINPAAADLASEETRRVGYDPRRLPEEIKMRIVQIVREDVPPRLPAVFLWNRALFLSLTVALVGILIAGVAGRRQGNT